jgi:uncharacterized protein (UPF0212 family)
MKKIDTTKQAPHTCEEMSAALFEFRDALVTLSLSMKDLLFEHDQKQRRATEQATQALFEKIKRP